MRWATRSRRVTGWHIFDTWGPRYFEGKRPSETAPVFTIDGICYVLLRRGSDSYSAQLGIAKPPYDAFNWIDLGVRIGGPEMIMLPNGQLLATVRLYDGRERTAISWVNHQEGTLKELLTLPSGGDTSYAGMVWHDDLLWMSYYSSHEGPASIYLAKLKLTTDAIEGEQGLMGWWKFDEKAGDKIADSSGNNFHGT